MDFYVVDIISEPPRPFYAKIDDARTTVEDDALVTNAFDMFIRGQEVLSGGQRTHDVDPNSAGIKEVLDGVRNTLLRLSYLLNHCAP
ncbi:hypothetical protein F4679DRAFT_527935 [Xylaria curta]|nr:hypothetical protein F4679DRAFT_527935 [Xylaria curta]